MNKRLVPLRLHAARMPFLDGLLDVTCNASLSAGSCAIACEAILHYEHMKHGAILRHDRNKQ